MKNNRLIRCPQTFLIVLLLGTALHCPAQLGTNGWNFKMTNFVIGAWAGPSISEAEIKAYAQCGFNTVMVGRYMAREGLIDYYADPAQVQLGLDLAHKYGLGAFIDCYTQNAHPWGGLPVSSGSGQHPFNLEEFQWVQARFGQDPALVGYLLGDDQGSVDGRMASIAAYMRAHCPQLFPWISGFCSGPTLYNNGVPSSSQEIYPTLYSWGNSADWQVCSYSDSYYYYSRSLQSYGLPFWPMPNICPSDSLNRFPAYASVAYGAKGVLYFTYAYGAMQQNGPFWTDAAVQAALTPNYAVGQVMNHRIAAWSPWIMDRNSPGLFGTLPLRCDGLAAPATNKLVAAADDRLIIGILTKPGANPLAMVVNGLTSKNFNALPPRKVTIQFNSQVTGIDIIEGGVLTHTNGNVITLTLDPGSGQLLQLDGTQLDKLSTADAIYGIVPPGITWDAGSGSAGAQDGGGTWDTATANWWNGSTDIIWSNATTAALSAVIGCGSGAAGTIALNGTIYVDYLTFNPTGGGYYTLTGGTINMQSGGIITANADATILSPIASGDMAFVKRGPATLTLGGTNSLGNGAILNQGVVVSQGTLQLNNNSAAGGGTITLGDTETGTNAVTLAANSGSANFANAIIVSTNGTGSATISGNQNYLTFTGPMTLNRPVTFGGTASDRYDYSGQISGNAGTLTIDAPRVTFSQTAQNNFTGTVVINSGRTLQINSSFGLSTTNAVIANGTLRVVPGAGNTVTTGTLTGGGAVNANSGGGNFLSTLALGGDNGSGTFSGTLANGSAGDTLAITKIGSGIQTLTGANTLTGNTTISAGTLALAGSATLANSAQISVGGGATFDVSALAGTFTLAANQILGGSGSVTGNVATATGSILAPGIPGTQGTLTFQNNLALTNATLNFDLATNTAAGAGVNDLIQLAGGTLTLRGTNFVNLNFLNGAPTGTYTLIQGAGTIIGGATNFVLANTVRTNWSVTFDTTSVPGSVLLKISGATTALLWRGTNGGNWDLATTNWERAGAADRFWNGDLVVFDDTAANGAVHIAAPVAPASTLVSNSTLPYTFSGSAITTGSLTKRGAGTLTLAGANSYAGGTTISQGTIVADNAVALGPASSTLTLGDSATGANAANFEVDTGVVSAVALAALNTTSFGTNQTITLNAGSALGVNQPELTIGALNLNGSLPLTIKATNTGGHGTAQDIVYSLAGRGIPAGSTALILDGTAAALRTSFPAGAAPNNFTGDVVIKGAVTTQGRTYLGQTAANQNLGFLNNNVTVSAGATWTLVWGGETVASLNGAGNVSFFNQNALNNIGLTVGSDDGSGSFSGGISGGFGLAKIGGGTQTLSGAGIAYSGYTTVADGTLRLVNATALGSPSITINPGATLELNSSGAWSIAELLVGGGQVVKTGSGSVTLGATAYSGPTLINGGTLNISDDFGPSASLTVNAGGTLNGSGDITGTAIINNGGTISVAAGTPFSFPSLTFAGGTATFNVTGDATGIPGIITVTNADRLTVNGTVTVNVEGSLPPVVPGVYTLISYSGVRGGAGNFVIGSLPGHMAGFINDTGSAIQLVVTNLGPNTMWWAGAPANDWYVSGGLVWRATSDGSPVAFTNGATAFFDDRASNFVVNVVTNVLPDMVSVTASNNYTFQGASIFAANAFLKGGSGNLTLLNRNSFASAALWGGTLQLGNGGTNGWMSLSGNLALSNSATLVFWRSDDLNFSNNIQGDGNFLKLGTNTLALTGTNTCSGVTVIGGGTLALGSAANLSSDSALVFSNGAALNLTAPMTLANNVTIAGGQTGTIRIGGSFTGTLSGNYSGMAGTLVLDETASTNNYNGFNAGSASGPVGTVVVLPPTSASVWGQLSEMGVNSSFLGKAKFVLPATGSVYVQCGNDGGAASGAQFGALDGGNGSTLVAADNRSGYNYVITGTASGNFGGIIENGGAAGANNLIKTGPGTQTLSGTNTYTGTTTISNGTLLVNGSLAAASAVTVRGGTLGGTGTIGGMVTVQSGGTLAPGGAGTGTLTLNATPSLAGTTLLKISEGAIPNSGKLAVSGHPLTYGGALTVTNIGANLLTAGDTFILFRASSFNGGFAATNLPSLAPGLGWTWTPSSGTLAVVATVNLTPTNMVVSVNGGQLKLKWPADHTGWWLQAQTNKLTQGLGTNWFDVAGSSITNQMTLPINPGNPSVFYRLAFP